MARDEQIFQFFMDLATQVISKTGFYLVIVEKKSSERSMRNSNSYHVASPTEVAGANPFDDIFIINIQ